DSTGEQTKAAIEKTQTSPLREFLGEDIGFMFVLGQMDVFAMSTDVARRLQLRPNHLFPVVTGDEIRNWEIRGNIFAIFPYDTKTIELLKFTKHTPEGRWFSWFRESLSNRPTFSGTFAEAGREIYEYHQLPVASARNLR